MYYNLQWNPGNTTTIGTMKNRSPNRNGRQLGFQCTSSIFIQILIVLLASGKNILVLDPAFA